MIASDQTVCGTCGNPILLTTAAKYEGECVPCKKGYRESLWATKHWLKEQKKLAGLPDALYWKNLINRVHKGDGFESLSQPEKLFFAVCCFDGDVYNGGFYQYFSNSSADYHPWVVEGLSLLGAFTSLSLLNEATTMLYENDPVPKHSVARNLRLKELEQTDEWPGIDTRLDNLDSQYYKYLDNLIDVLREFGVRNRFWADPNESSGDG